MNYPSAPASHQSGSIGAREVSSLLERQGAVVLSSNPERDYGIDLICAVRSNNDKVLPYTFGVQVKSHGAAAPKGLKSRVSIDQHFLYWSENTMPIFAVNWYADSNLGLVGDTISSPGETTIETGFSLENALPEMYFRTILSTHCRDIGITYRNPDRLLQVPQSDTWNLASTMWARLAWMLRSIGVEPMNWRQFQSYTSMMEILFEELGMRDEINLNMTGVQNLENPFGCYGTLAPKYIAESLIMESFEIMERWNECPGGVPQAGIIVNATLELVESMVGEIVARSKLDQSNWSNSEFEITGMGTSDFYREHYRKFHQRACLNQIDLDEGRFDELFDTMGRNHCP